jgi:hypothetical protein
VKTFILYLLVASSAYASHYWSLSSGGTLASPEKAVILDQYPLYLHGINENGDKTFEVHQVDVRGKYKPGHRITMSSGYQLLGWYRLEIEGSYSKDSVALRHYSSSGVSFGPTVHERRIISMGANIGGQLPGFRWGMPYSLVGMGIRASHIKGRDPQARAYYQWVLGMDIPIGGWFDGFVQHRMQKALKDEGVHSVEVGVRTHR